MVSFITFPIKWKIDLIIYDAFLSITAFTASQLYFKRLNFQMKSFYPADCPSWGFTSRVCLMAGCISAAPRKTMTTSSMENGIHDSWLDFASSQVELQHPAECGGHGGGDRGRLQTQIHSWRSDIRHVTLGECVLLLKYGWCQQP